MGISHLNFDLLGVALDELGGTYEGLNIVQFGNLFFTMDLEKQPPPGGDRVFKFTRDFFQTKGAARVVDIDLGFKQHAKCRQKLDLGKPLGKWAGEFDLLTNYGTSEHVHNQYHCFKNAHDLVRTGGVMVHAVPAVGSWPGHCLFWYTLPFFSLLAGLNGYKVLCREIRPKPKPERELTCVVLLKETDQEFCSEEDFAKLWDGSEPAGSGSGLENR